jgi:hypothetical protein
MRLTSDTHFQYADAAPAVHATLPGDRRLPSALPMVPITGPNHPHALARRPMR